MLKDIIDSVTGVFKGGGDAITDVVSVAKGKLPPDQMVELEIIESNFKLELAKAEILAIEKAKEFILKDEQPERQPDWLITWKGLIRPAFATIIFLTLIMFFGVDIFNIVSGVKDYELIIDKLPGGYWGISSIIIGFYFAAQGFERTLTNIRGKNAEHIGK
jgi:hypothetical protein